MIRYQRHYSVVLILIGLCGAILARDGKQQEKPSKWRPMVQTVEDILTGRNLDRTSVSIAPWAKIVVGSTLEKLHGVVTGKGTIHIQDTSAIPVSVELKTNDSEDATYLILGTRNTTSLEKRFHTVAFMKDSLGVWKIESWQTCR